MEVPENSVAEPEPNKLDVALDAQTEEVYGTSGTEGASGNALGFKT